MKHMGYKDIPLGKLHPHPANPNVCSDEIMAKLTENIRRTDFVPSLIVRVHPTEEGAYQIIDGAHRKQALETLSYKKAPCEVLEATDAETNLLLATLNRLRGEDNPRKRAELLSDLANHIDADELTKFIPETTTQLQDLLTLLDFEEETERERLQQEIEKETEEMPVHLTFLLSKVDAAFVQEVLAAHQPEETEDPSAGLVALCRLVQGNPNTEESE